MGCDEMEVFIARLPWMRALAGLASDHADRVVMTHERSRSPSGPHVGQESGKCFSPTAWPVSLPRPRAMMGMSFGPKATTTTPTVTIHSPTLNPRGMVVEATRTRTMRRTRSSGHCGFDI